MTVLVVDYGMSNLGSIRRALEECGAQVAISDNTADLKTAERIVLPGVGAFCDGMANLIKGGWVDALRNEVLQNRIPLLGICLGMQLLADKGYEGRECGGMGLLSGEVKRLERSNKNERIPHVGWNEIYKMSSSPLLEGIKDGSDFYFVHSFHFIPNDDQNIKATTPYCGGFVSVVAHENIFGTQFHPEKSQVLGFQILKNFLNY